MFKGFNYFLNFAWKNNKKYVIVLFLSQIIGSVIPLISIVLPKFLIDELLTGKSLKKVILITTLLLLTTVLGNIVTSILNNYTFYQRIKLFNTFTVQNSQKMIKADYEKIESQSFLDTKQKAEKYLYGDWRGFGVVFEDFVSIIGHVVKFIGIIFIISRLNFFIVLMMITLVLITSYIDSIYKKKSYEIEMKKMSYERKINYFTNIIEDFRYGKEIRVGNLGDWLISKYKNHLKITEGYYKENTHNNIKVSTISAFTMLIQQSITYSYVVYKVLKNSISIGDFSMYISAMIQFSDSMKAVMSSIIQTKQYSLYYTHLDEYLNMPEKMREGKKLSVDFPNKPHTIEFVDVSFKYPGQDKYTLKDISLKINSGESLSIVGENGAGKTTFTKLLCRLYDPTAGAIYIDGVNIKDIDYEKYMNLLSVVFQDYKLFSMSIKENVVLNNSNNIDDKEVYNILERSGLKDTVDTLSEGIYTTIFKEFDDKGIELSGGQGQKLALARALYKNTGIVILDEPTASLDPKAEYEIFSKFNELTKNKTAIYISHRLSSTRFSDNIAVFKDGKLLEYGNHDTLYKAKGEYYTMFECQAKYYVN